MALQINIPFNLELESAAREFNRFIMEVKASLGKMGESIRPIDENKFKRSFQGIETGAKKVGEGLKGVGDEAQKQTVKVQGFGKAFQFAAIAQSITIVKDSVNQLTQPFVKLDTATARIKTLGGESKAMAEDFKDLSIKMSKDIPIGAADMQTALYDALSAGIKPTKKGIESFMTAAGKLAVGGMESVGNTVNLLSSITNAYGLAAETAGESSDYLFQTVNLGKTTIPELNASLSQVIPTAAAAGVNLQNVGASLALMTANGVPTAQASTKLNALLVELQKGGGKLNPILKKAGVSLESLKNEPLVDNLERMKKAFEESGTTATQAFGSIEASSAFNVLTKDIGKYRDMLDQMNNSTGTTQAAFEEMENTVENRSAKAKIAFETFVIGAIDKSGAFGTTLVTTTKILGEMQAPIMALAALKTVIPTQQIGQMATALIAKFVPAAVMTNTVTGATTISFKALSAALLTNPIFLMTTALVGLGVALNAISGSWRNAAKSQLESAKGEAEALKTKKELVEKQKTHEESNIRLIEQYKELGSKANLTKEEERKLADMKVELASRYPGVITATDNFNTSLNKLDTQVLSSKEKLKAYAKIITSLGGEFRKAEAKIVSSQRNVIKKELEDLLVDQTNFGIDFISGAGEAIAGTSTVRTFYENFIRPYTNAIYKAKSDPQIDNAILKFTNKIYGKDSPVNVEARKSALDKFKEFAEAQRQTLIAWTGKIAESVTVTKPPPTPIGTVNDNGEIWNGTKWVEKTGGRGGKDKKNKQAKIDLDNEIIQITRETSKILDGIRIRSIEDDRKRDIEAAKSKQADMIADLEAERKKYEEMKNVEAGDKEKMLKALNKKLKAIEELGQKELYDINKKYDEKEDAENKKKKDKEKSDRAEEIAEQEAHGRTLAELAGGMGQAFGEGIARGDVAGSLKNMLLEYLNYIHGIMIATQVEILAKNLATADSIASFGISGFIKAGLQIAAIEALYQVAKGVIGARQGGRIRGGHQIIRINEEGEEGVLTADAMKIQGTETSMEWMNMQKRPVWENPLVKRKVIENVTLNWDDEDTVRQQRITHRGVQAKKDIEFISESFLDENGKLIFGKQTNQELKQIRQEMKEVKGLLQLMLFNDKKPKELELKNSNVKEEIITNDKFARFIDNGNRALIRNK